uniref:Uncharacterized protein n=1 Tax=Callorhinchus milii TaxID=7868 RepID=A0A4W3GVF4_CALMI
MEVDVDMIPEDVLLYFKSVDFKTNPNCDLDGATISTSHISILEQLKNCVSYTKSQKSAIEALLNNSPTRYGLPSSWTSLTLDELGNLPLTFTFTWKHVNLVALQYALPRFLKRLKTSNPPNVVLGFIDQLKLQANFTETCTELAAEDIDELTPIKYDAVQLDKCLSHLVLKNNIFVLGTLSFDSTQLHVLKYKLVQLYPNGLPEDTILLLGNISTVFNATEMSSWNITQVDTLGQVLLNPLKHSQVRK